jgi:hypothetical protein
MVSWDAEHDRQRCKLHATATRRVNILRRFAATLSQLGSESGRGCLGDASEGRNVSGIGDLSRQLLVAFLSVSESASCLAKICMSSFVSREESTKSGSKVPAAITHNDLQSLFARSVSITVFVADPAVNHIGSGH